MARSDIHVQAATPTHALHLVRGMRDADLQEMHACGFGALEGLIHALSTGLFAQTLFINGEVACMFGAMARLDAWQMWLLTSKAVDRYPHAFARASRGALRYLLECCPELRATVDARYTAAVRWVRWLGFEVGEPVPHGPHGLPFHPIRIRRTPWASSPTPSAQLPGE